jgi:hypothetical protein
LRHRPTAGTIVRVESTGEPRIPVPDLHPEPQNVQEISPQLDFLYRAENAFQQWLQFADAKAGGVILILSIGILDLFRRAKDLLNATDLPSSWGYGATISFALAMVCGVLAIFQVGRALFPRHIPGSRSLFFFGSAAAYPSAETYGDAVYGSYERDLIYTMATQAWYLARISREKYRHLRVAYASALLFVVLWGMARLTLSLAQ